MVGIFSAGGQGLGGSIDQLGGKGLLGTAASGRSRENLYLNAANGNLVIQRRDEYLAGLGEDLGLVRTYNSRGGYDDGDNRDGWRMSTYRGVRGLTGTVNTADSAIWRMDGDGRQARYVYDAARGVYRGADGEGADDTLAYDASRNTWTWNDGAGDRSETYLWNGAEDYGRLTALSDADGNTQTYVYDGAGLLSRVELASGESVVFRYAGSNLSAVETVGRDGAVAARTSYAYDRLNRLVQVRITLGVAAGDPVGGDLPSGAFAIDGGEPVDTDGGEGGEGGVYVRYTIDYSYDGDSKRLRSLREKDGTYLMFGYAEVDGEYRLSTVTDLALNRVTSYDYDTANGRTTVIDPLGARTVLHHDAQGRLTKVEMPAVGEVKNIVRYEYDAAGRVTRMTDAAGRAVEYGYDAAGNRTWQQDAFGTRIERTYGADNKLLSETVFAPDDPHSGRTTRHAYDAEGHLRFTVSAAGRVVEYRYTAAGLLEKEFHYADAIYVGDAGLGELESWAAARDKTRAELTQYSYDFRGQLSAVKRFAATLVDGSGDAYGGVTTVNYLYDQHGRLLSKVDDKNQGTVFVHDGLDRILSSSTAGFVTVYDYADEFKRTTITTAEGVQTVQQYDAAGELISVARGDAPATTYEYDANGRLRREIDPTGIRKFYLYNAEGRMIAAINGSDGKMTEYAYNSAGLLTRTIDYAGVLTSWHLAQLQSTGVGGTEVPPLFSNINNLGTYRPAPHPDDRVQWSLYDNQGRLAKRIDALGGLTEFQYGGAGELLATIRYDEKVEQRVLDGLTVESSPEAVTADRDSGCPVELRVYDADGKLLGVIDAENRLVEYRYDAAGRMTRMIAYANPIRSDDGHPYLRPDLETIRPLPDDGKDQHTWYWHDDRGQVTAMVDPEFYLSTYVYDQAGRQTEVLRYAGRLTVAVPDSTIEQMRANADVPGKNQLTRYEYNAQGLLQSETAPNGLVTYHTYDRDGRLRATTQDYGSAAARTTARLYDAKGRLWRSYDGVNRATSYQYDHADRLISSTDSLGNRTVYYYDAHGRLTHTINALGETQRTVYDQFGQAVENIRYAAKINTSTVLPTLTGGLANTTLRQAIDAIYNAANDSRLRWSYDRVGQLMSATDARGNATVHEYDILGNRRHSRQALGDGRTRHSSYEYDLRGRLTRSAVDPSGIDAEQRLSYDAFGRIIAREDARHGITFTSYDRLGRVVTVTDPRNHARVSSYDAFGRVLTQTDALGKTTATSYTPDNRSVTVRSPEGISVTTEYNKFGELYKLTDGNGKTTTYEYDKAGRLIKVTSPNNDVTRTDYVSNRMTVTDPGGMVTVHVFDAANRTSTVTVDPNGLNLVTRYDYDGKGQRVKVIDALGVVTETGFDLNGHVKSVVIDPNGLNLRTEYVSDPLGNLLSVTEGAGSPAARTTTYHYDKLGRRDWERVDPNGANLLTSYTYDDAGNLVAKTGPDGRIHRYGYDANNRLVLSVDPEGIATVHEYDANGRQIRSTVHARPLSGLPAPATMAAGANWAAGIVPQQDDADRTDRTVYNSDGLVRYRIDAGRRVTGYEYDGNGNVARQTRYARTDWTLDAQHQLSIGSSPEDRVTGTVYNAVNLAIWEVDELGRATGIEYDKAGRETRRTQYATPIAWPRTALPRESDFTGLSATGARRSGKTYDKAGRLRAEVDGLGQVRSYEYDKANRVTGVTSHAGTVSWSSTVALESQVAILLGTGNSLNRKEITIYDKAGREVYRLNALKEVTATRCDASGLVVGSTAYAKAYTGTAYDKTSLDNFYGLAANQSADDRKVEVVRDSAGRVAYEVDAQRNVTRHRYDSLGNPAGSIRYANGYSGTVNKANLDAWYSPTANPSHLSAHDRQTAIVEDKANRRLFRIDAEGHVELQQMNEFGELESSTLLAAAIAGWRSGASVPNAGALADMLDAGRDRTSHVVRNALGQVVRSMNAAGEVVEYRYGDFGETIETRRYGTAGALDAAGAIVVPANAPHRVEYAQYDAAGRILRSMNAAGEATEYAYNSFGDTIATRRYAALGDWDEAARKIAVGAGDADRVDYADYNALGLVTRSMNAAGEVCEFVYGNFGQVISTRHYAKAGSWNGTTKSIAVPSGTAYRASYVQYDSLGRAVRTLNAAGEIGETIYDSFGQAVSTRQYAQAGSWSDDAKTIVIPDGATFRADYRQFDRLGRMTRSMNAAGEVAEQIYDSLGDVIATRRYANQGSWDNRTISVQAGSADRTSYAQYDRLGRVTRNMDAAGGVTDTVYGKFGESVATVRYARAGIWNDIAKTIAVDGDGADRRSYTERDALGRVVRTLDAEGGVTEVGFNGFGEVIKTRQYALSGYWDGTAETVVTDPDAADRFGYLQRDVLGRVTRSVDALGNVSGTRYDHFGNAVETIRYARAGSWNEAHQAIAVDEDGADRFTCTEYDALNRIVRTLDAHGNVDETTYDALGDAIKTRQYARPGSWNDSTNSIGATAAAGDRIAYVQYDALGRVKRVMNALRDVKEIEYNLFGEAIKTRHYAGPGNWDEASGTVGAAGGSGDRIDYAAYDARGRLTRSMNALGEVKEIAYNRFGDAIKTTRYAGQGNWNEATRSIGVAAGEERIDYAEFDALGRVVRRMDALLHVSENTYDRFGNVIVSRDYAGQGGWNGAANAIVVEAGAADRVEYAQYNALNRVTRRMDAAGCVTGTSYGRFGEAVATTRYANLGHWDGASGTIEVDWDTNVDRTSYMERDTLGRVVRTLEATRPLDRIGSAKEIRYNRFGEAVATVEYASSARWNGDDNRVVVHADAAKDRVEYTQYDALGQVVRRMDAMKTVTETFYGRFGEATATRQYAAAGSWNGAEQRIEVDFDGRRDRLSFMQRDALGRVVRTLDATNPLDKTGIARETVYNRFGEAIATTLYAQAASWNADDGTVSVTADAVNDRTSRVQYDAAGRAWKRMDGERQVTETTYDRFGQALRVRQYARAGNWSADGVISADADPADRISGSVFDAAGNQQYAIDWKGGVTRLVRNAFDEVVTTVAYAATIAWPAEGAALATALTGLANGGNAQDRYSGALRDALGRVSASIDPSGRVTQIAYDNFGDKTGETVRAQRIAPLSATHPVLTTQDVSAVQARAADAHTAVAYDAAGRAVMEIDADGNIREFAYDGFGRRTLVIEHAAPTAPRSAADGALTAADVQALTALGKPLDPADRYLGTAYDADGQVSHTIDAKGAVTRILRNRAGEQNGEVRYATLIAWPQAAASLNESFVQGIVSPDPLNDRHEASCLDTLGRVVASIDAGGRVVQYGYNAAGQVTSILRRTSPLDPRTADNPGLSPDDLAAIAPSPEDRYEARMYDDNGRLTASVDALGGLTITRYNAYGEIAGTTQRANRVQPGNAPWPAAPLSEAALAAAVGAVAPHADDRSSYTFYQGATRYDIDAERHVTATIADAFGRPTAVTRYPQCLAVDPAGLAAITDAMVAGLSAADSQGVGPATTITRYDTAGRVVSVTDPLNRMTTTEYDTDSAIGQTVTVDVPGAGGSHVTLTRVICGSERIVLPDGTVTLREFDADGLLIQQIESYGTAEAVATRYAYNAFGDMVAAVDARGIALAESDSGWARRERAALGYLESSSMLGAADKRALMARYTLVKTYDSNGRVTASADATGATVRMTYDSFGNLVEETNALGGKTHNYYDKLDRRWLAIDAARRYTKTVYDDVRNQRIVTHGGVAAGVGYMIGQPPASLSAPTDTVATARDKLDRVTETRETLPGEAERKVVDGYNVFGERDARTVHDADFGSATTICEYTKLGQLRTEIVPGMTSDGRAVVNSYVYDARGNLIAKRLAQGSADERATVRRYDAAGQLRSEGPANAVMVFTEAGGWQSATLTTEYAYDARGRAVQIKDAAGNISRTWYNSLGHVIGTVNGAGTLTRMWTDPAGNAYRVDIYGDAAAVTPVAMIGDVAQPGPVPSGSINNMHSIAYRYDGANRRTSSKIVNVLLGELDRAMNADGGYVSYYGDVTEQTAYDAAGNVIRQIDAQGNVTRSWYDAVGRKLLQVDQAGYVTAWSYTLTTTTEKRYGSAVTLPAAALDAMPAADVEANALANTGTATGNEARQVRTTVTTYNGRGETVKTEVQTGAGTAITTYAHNGLGLVARKTDADGVTTTFKYDALGRMVRQTVELEVIDENGDNVGWQADASAASTQVTDFEYNGVGETVRTIRRGADGLADRIVMQRYNGAGQLIAQSDAANYGWTTFGYDRAGRRSWEAKVLQDADGNRKAVVSSIVQDAAGRESRRTTFTKAEAWSDRDGMPQVDTGAWAQAGWTAGTVQEYRYDSYGQLTAKGERAYGAASYTLQEFFEYDNAGRLFKTNSGDGATKIILRDARGNATLTLRSSGTLDLRHLSLSQVANLSPAQLAGMTLTVSVFDARGLAVETIVPRESVADVMTRIAERLGAVENSNGGVTLQVDASRAPSAVPIPTPGAQTLQVSIGSQLLVTTSTGVPSSALALTYSSAVTEADLDMFNPPAPYAVYCALALRNITVTLPTLPGMEDNNYVVVYSDGLGSLQTEVAGTASQATISLPNGNSIAASRLAAAGGNFTVTVYKRGGDGQLLQVATKSDSLTAANGPDYYSPWLRSNLQTVTYTRTINGDREATFTCPLVPSGVRSVQGRTVNAQLLQLTQLPSNTAAVSFGYRPLGSTIAFLPAGATRVSADGSHWMVDYSAFNQVPGLSDTYEYAYAALDANGRQISGGSGRLTINGAGTSVTPDPQVFSSVASASVAASGSATGVGYPGLDLAYQIYHTPQSPIGDRVDSVVIPLTTLAGMSAFDTGGVDQWEAELIDPQTNTLLYRANADAGASAIVMQIGADLPWRSYSLRLYRRIDDFGARIQLATDSMRIPLASGNPVPGAMSVIEIPPRLVIGGVPAGTAQVTLGCRPAGSGGAMQYVNLPNAALFGHTRPDLFHLLLPEGGFARNTAYEFEYFALDAGGVAQARSGGNFSVDNAGNVAVSHQAPLPVGGIGSARFQPNGILSIVDAGRSATADPNAAPTGTHAKVKYRLAGSSNWSADVNMRLDGLLPNAFNWNCQGMAAGIYEYCVTVLDDNERAVNQLGGRVQLGASPALLSYGRWQDCPGMVKIKGVPAGTASVQVAFTRNGVVTQIAAIASASDPGLFFWDPASHGLAGADGTYTVTAKNADGATLAAYGGALNLGQGAQTVRGNRAGGASAARANVAAWQWELNGLDLGALSVHRKTSYDAFGEQIAQTDALGNTTQMQYDAAGRLTARIAPRSSIENADGSTTAFTPTTRYAYSAGGRVIRVVDVLDADDPDNAAKNIVARYSYLAGAQAKDGGPLVHRELHADDSVKTMRYNVFGEVDKSTDERGHATGYEYDRNGNLTKRKRPTGSSGAEESDSYTYDAAGNRTSHTVRGKTYGAGTFDPNTGYYIGSYTAYSATDKSYYDATGRVTMTVSAGNKVKRYTYIYDQNVKGLNDQAVGGYRQVVSEDGSGAPHAQETWTSYFGQKTYHRDFGGNETWYRYNQANLMLAEQHLAGTGATARVNKRYDYYANGALKSVADEGVSVFQGGQLTRYGYDANGQTVSIALSSIDGRSHLYNETAIRYDGNGRQIRVTDRRADVRYSHDQVGNIRHMHADYNQLGWRSASQDYWYAYDKMNRQTVAMGGWGYDADGRFRILAGDFGVNIAYDAAGNRREVAYGIHAQANKNKGAVQIETYTYDADNNNIKVDYRHGNTHAASFHVRSGNVAISQEVSYANAYYSSPRLRATTKTTYDGDGNIATRDTQTADLTYNAPVKHNIDVYHYSGGVLSYIDHTQETLQHEEPVNGSTVSSATHYGYAWGDSARQTSFTTWLDNNGNREQQSMSRLTYDFNGHLTVSTTNDLAGNDRGQREIRYMVNGGGQVLQSDEFFRPQTPDASHRITHFHNQYVATDRKTVGYLSNRGSEVSNYTAPTTDDPGLPSPLATTVADFDQSFAPMNQASNANMGGGAVSYTVRAGDTLQSIAQTVWGDAALWFHIAEANGMGGGQPLQIGQVLSLPNNVVATRHTSTTTRPNQAAQIDSLVSLAGPAGQQQCGTTQLLIIAAIGVAVTVATGGLAAVAAGAVFGIASTSLAAVVIGGGVGAGLGSMATQGLKIATGLQKEFSWNEVAQAAVMGGITAGIGSGIGGVLKESGNAAVQHLSRVAMAGVENAAKQGVDNVFGTRKGFDALEFGLSIAGALAPGGGKIGMRSFATSFGVSMATGAIRDAAANRRTDFGKLAGESAGQAALGTLSGWLHAERDDALERYELERDAAATYGYAGELDRLRSLGAQAVLRNRRDAAASASSARYGSLKKALAANLQPGDRIAGLLASANPDFLPVGNEQEASPDFALLDREMKLRLDILDRRGAEGDREFKPSHSSLIKRIFGTIEDETRRHMVRGKFEEESEAYSLALAQYQSDLAAKDPSVFGPDLPPPEPPIAPDASGPESSAFMPDLRLIPGDLRLNPRLAYSMTHARNDFEFGRMALELPALGKATSVSTFDIGATSSLSLGLEVGADGPRIPGFGEVARQSIASLLREPSDSGIRMSARIVSAGIERFDGRLRKEVAYDLALEQYAMASETYQAERLQYQAYLADKRRFEEVQHGPERDCYAMDMNDPFIDPMLLGRVPPPPVAPTAPVKPEADGSLNGLGLRLVKQKPNLFLEKLHHSLTSYHSLSSGELTLNLPEWVGKRQIDSVPDESLSASIANIGPKEFAGVLSAVERSMQETVAASRYYPQFTPAKLKALVLAKAGASPEGTNPYAVAVAYRDLVASQPEKYKEWQAKHLGGSDDPFDWVLTTSNPLTGGNPNIPGRSSAEVSEAASLWLHDRLLAAYGKRLNFTDPRVQEAIRKGTFQKDYGLDLEINNATLLRNARRTPSGDYAGTGMGYCSTLTGIGNTASAHPDGFIGKNFRNVLGESVRIEPAIKDGKLGFQAVRDAAIYHRVGDGREFGEVTLVNIGYERLDIEVVRQGGETNGIATEVNQIGTLMDGSKVALPYIFQNGDNITFGANPASEYGHAEAIVGDYFGGGRPVSDFVQPLLGPSGIYPGRMETWGRAEIKVYRRPDFPTTYGWMR